MTPKKKPDTKWITAGLTDVSPLQRAIALGRPLLTLALLAWALAAEQWLWVLPLLLAHFIVSVSVVHDLAHYSLGLSRSVNDRYLMVFSALLLEAGHAYRLSHLHHHRHYPADHDLEGRPRSIVECLLVGPVYIPKLWLWGYRRCVDSGNRKLQNKLITELLVAVVSLAVSLVVGFGLDTWWPLQYCGLVVVAAWFYPLLTTYLPHFHGEHDNPDQPAQSIRGRLIPKLLVGMSYHLEHHLYPQVPTANLAVLAARLDPYYPAMGYQTRRWI